MTIKIIIEQIKKVDTAEQLYKNADEKLEQALDSDSNFETLDKITDELYKNFWNLASELSEQIIEFTGIDKQTARKMAFEKRIEIKNILTRTAQTI